MNTQPTDPIVYIPVPVSEPPKEDGAYMMLFKDGLFSGNMFTFRNGKWPFNPILKHYTHWLKPVPLSSLTNDRIKELEASLIKSLTVVRHSRNVEYSVTVPEIRSEGVKAEMAIEEILGTKEYARICEIAFNTK